MSNNAPDYTDNLAFPPQGDWSDTQPKNNTDRTQSSCDMVDKIEKLSKQLKIAIEALELYRQENWNYQDEYINYPCKTGGWIHAEKAIKQIKELNI